MGGEGGWMATLCRMGLGGLGCNFQCGFFAGVWGWAWPGGVDWCFEVGGSMSFREFSVISDELSIEFPRLPPTMILGIYNTYQNQQKNEIMSNHWMLDPSSDSCSSMVCHRCGEGVPVWACVWRWVRNADDSIELCAFHHFCWVRWRMRAYELGGA